MLVLIKDVIIMIKIFFKDEHLHEKTEKEVVIRFECQNKY